MCEYGELYEESARRDFADVVLGFGVDIVGWSVNEIGVCEMMGKVGRWSMQKWILRHAKSFTEIVPNPD